MIRKRQFSALVSEGSNGTMTSNRYIRLMALCILDMVLNVPLTVVVMALAASELNFPYTSWSKIHEGFNAVGLFGPQFYASGQHRIELARWVYPVAAFIFFAIFGLTADARAPYKRMISSMTQSAGLKRLTGNRMTSWSIGRSQFVDLWLVELTSLTTIFAQGYHTCDSSCEWPRRTSSIYTLAQEEPVSGLHPKYEMISKSFPYPLSTQHIMALCFPISKFMSIDSQSSSILVRRHLSH